MKKKIYKQWWFYLIIVLIIISIPQMFVNDLSQNNTPEEKKEINNSEETKDKYYIIDTFISKYNENSSRKISNSIEIDIQDKESGYYRTEYRLNAFNGALAKQSTIGNYTMDIVNYRVSNDYPTESSDLRIYITVDTYEDMQIILESILKVMDSNITSEDINDIYDTLEVVSSKSLVLGQSDEITGYINKNNSNKYEIMIDTSKIYFLN